MEAPLSTYLPPRHPDPSEPCDLLQALARLDSARPPAEMPPEKTPSPANSQDSHLLDTNALNATASAPEHPSTPISVAASLSTPPCTSSPSGSVAPTTASEGERILAAVTHLEPDRATYLTDLLMQSPEAQTRSLSFISSVIWAPSGSTALT
jgi:polyadenylate-binding protein